MQTFFNRGSDVGAFIEKDKHTVGTHLCVHNQSLCMDDRYCISNFYANGKTLFIATVPYSTNCFESQTHNIHLE